jgi:hypothetical protein
VAGNFLTELRRRNVFRVAAAYLVVAGLILQIVNTLAPLLGVPDWVGPTVFIFLVAGFPVLEGARLAFLVPAARRKRLRMPVIDVRT